MAMRAESAETLMTAEELLVLHLPDKSTELVRGRLIVREPPGSWHGQVSVTLGALIWHHARHARLGRVFGQDTGFKIGSNPDTVRAPDVAFLREERAGLIGRRGYAEIAPDLVAEIVSPGDRRGEVLEKVGQWLAAGSRLVWVIDPERRQAQVYRPDGSVTLIDEAGALDGEDVLAGFSCTLEEVLS